MAHIKTRKGLDLPIKGKPKGGVQKLAANGREVLPKRISLNFNPFDDIQPKLIAKVDDVVKIGQPVISDKKCPDRVFVAPAGGVIREVRRGLKRRLLDVVIEITDKEEYVEHPPLSLSSASQEEILSRMKEGGLFAHIRRRPFNLLADPEKLPRAIFVKAIESAPFVPSAEMQVEGHEEHFQTGLDALAKLCSEVHLVHHRHSGCRAFTAAKNVQIHTAEGPHPIANPSVHIHYISPIKKVEEVVWTIGVHDVVLLGYLFNTGRYFTERVVSVAGPGLLPEKCGFFRARTGIPVESLIGGRVIHEPVRFISGDPLTGEQVDVDGFLEFYDYALTVIPENVSREFLHFFRLGVNKFTNSGTYLSGHLKHSEREYNFTTNMHGEHRFFISQEPYEKVMPMNIPVMHLTKAVIAEDFDLAEELGLLEIDSEDFALPTFVCPSKMEMVDIIGRALKSYAKEVVE